MDIIEVISNVGFPIAAFLIMTWMNVSVIRENTKAITELTKVISNLNEEKD